MTRLTIDGVHFLAIFVSYIKRKLRLRLFFLNWRAKKQDSLERTFFWNCFGSGLFGMELKLSLGEKFWKNTPIRYSLSSISFSFFLPLSYFLSLFFFHSFLFLPLSSLSRSLFSLTLISCLYVSFFLSSLSLLYYYSMHWLNLIIIKSWVCMNVNKNLLTVKHPLNMWP